MLEDQSLQSISEVSFCGVGIERFLLCNMFFNNQKEEVKWYKAGLYRIDNYQGAVIMATNGPLVTITSQIFVRFLIKTKNNKDAEKLWNK